MPFDRKIYYYNKPLILTDDAGHYIANRPEAASYLLLKGGSDESTVQAIRHLEKPRATGVIIEGATEEALLAEIHKTYSPIDAAGGVVRNEHGDVLMIHRRGKWDLPKGKRDEGEDMETCALREVEEETGLKEMTLGPKICDTYHIYSQFGQDLLKRTAWYEMHTTTREILIPQAEENISEVRWIGEKDLTAAASQTYEAIKEVLRCAGFSW